MSYKPESGQAGEASTTSDTTDHTTLMAEKSLLMRVKEESERAGLRLNIKKKKKN